MIIYDHWDLLHKVLVSFKQTDNIMQEPNCHVPKAKIHYFYLTLSFQCFSQLSVVLAANESDNRGDIGEEVLSVFSLLGAWVYVVHEADILTTTSPLGIFLFESASTLLGETGNRTEARTQQLLSFALCRSLPPPSLSLFLSGLRESLKQVSTQCLHKGGN